ncbi:hypothetical protein [Nonomuraea africana]|uniref:Uncharacterized protein n=1 Tax=Nonomuraea africana TaxID=46171 RepID=A0ABR9K6Y4_9ACTN|nr:hypothetical protein [Nonomuraea africana]MBE1557782.1 hypothetical protein [Nonomuraea africana]
MSAVYTQRAEEEQIEQLEWVQERLAASGIRALLVRHLRLTLLQNRYDPPEHRGPVLMAGPVRISVDHGFHIERDDGRTADFLDADAAAAYVASAVS